eukprot:30517_1
MNQNYAPIVELKANNISSNKPDTELFLVLNKKVTDPQEINNNQYKLLYKRITESEIIIKTIEKHIKNTVNKVMQNMFNNIIVFLFKSNNNNPSCHHLCNLNEYTIPTAVICVQNTSEILLQLENKLQTSISNAIIVHFNAQCVDEINKIVNGQQIIIIIDNFEQCVTNNSLTLLINTLSIRNKNDVTFIMAVTTDENIIQKSIETNVLKFLTRKYFFEPTINLHSKLIHDVFDQLPILVTPSILHQMSNHSSIPRLVNEIKYLLYSHFLECDMNKYIQNQSSINKIRNDYQTALHIFQMIIEQLGFHWNTIETVRNLQNPDLMYKHLLSIFGISHPLISIKEEDKKNFPSKIVNFNEFYQIYQILELHTKSIDPLISSKASQLHNDIKQKLQPQNNKVNKVQPVPITKLHSKQQRSLLKQQLTLKTNKSAYTDARRQLLNLIYKFIHVHLKPMDQLQYKETFVYSNDKQFCNHMLPPNNQKLRDIIGKPCYPNVNISTNIEAEPISCLYQIYTECSNKYMNLHDAYNAFKQIYQNKNDLDAHEDNEDNDLLQLREKQTQIQFRMSVEDLIFCGRLQTAATKPHHLIKTHEML